MEDGELLDAAGGDRARGRVLGQLLRHLSRNSPDELLREMASGVLNGEVRLTDAVGASAYSEVVGQHSTGFNSWYGSLSETERTHQAQAGAKMIAKVRDEIDREGAEQHPYPQKLA